MTEPDWIVEGAQVAEVGGAEPFAVISITTVEEITPLWIVLANGRRYYTTTGRLYGSETDAEVLLPASDLRVRDVLARQILAGAITKLYGIARDQSAVTAADVVTVLEDLERVVQDAKAAAAIEDIAELARAAEGK